VSEHEISGLLSDSGQLKRRVLSPRRILLLVLALVTAGAILSAGWLYADSLAPAAEVGVPFPGYNTLEAAVRPTAHHGHLTPSDIARHRVPNGLPGKFTLEVFDLRDVLEQLVLGAVEWQSPCMGGANFGTQAPVLVMAISLDGLQPPGLLTAWATPRPAQCATPGCAEFGFAPMAAVRHGDIALPAALATRLMTGGLFLAMANPVCVPAPGPTKPSVEVVLGCPRDTPGGPFTVVSHRRAVTAVCSGTLLHPGGTHTAMSHQTFMVTFTGEAAVCVQNYANLAALDATLCTNTSTGMDAGPGPGPGPGPTPVSVPAPGPGPGSGPGK
jgi:hypothetical protein